MATTARVINMKTINNQTFTGERALFQSRGVRLVDCTMTDGESHIKESSDVICEGCTFGWKYPLWYGKNLTVTNSTLLPQARAAIWYSDNLTFTDVQIDAPKAFRRCNSVTITNVEFSDAAETMWTCNDVTLSNVHVVGNYFGMNCGNITADNLRIDGNYCFDGAHDIVVRNSVLNSKDSFWNCRNVTVYDTVINGEYLAWNSSNLTFVNCTINSLQGLCYVDGLTLVNCKLADTNLCFEYCTNIDADVVSDIVSVKNPISGRIVANSVKELIQDDPAIDLTKISVETRTK